LKKANPEYNVTELCELFNVNSSSYYYQAKEKVINPDRKLILAAIRGIALETGHTYGRRRINVELLSKGFSLGIHKTASLMSQANVVAITPKKRHYYPNSGEECRFAPNLLKRRFNPETINSHWVGDITYLKTHQGWSYLACVLDLGTREIVGWALSKSPDAQLAKDALNQALRKHQPDSSQLLFHSDQGVQYSANLFVEHLNKLKITQSMSRRGNCWDNAVMERFFRSLKSEKLNHLSFINHQSVVDCVEKYILFYNYKRLHSANGYMTPALKAKELRKVA